MSREIYTVSVVSKILVALQMVGTTYTGNPAPSLARCPPAELFSQSPGIANLKSLLFRDPACFTAGNIHNHFMRGNLCFPNMALPLGLLIFWISCEGVKIESLFKVSRNRLMEENSSSPPPSVFENSKSCLDFHPFISETILKWARTGVLTFIWPGIALPLTVEPSLPRLCHDDVSLSIRDLPFKLDHLADFRRVHFPRH